MTMKLVFLLLVFSAVNADVLKGGEELDADFEKRFKHYSNSWGKNILTYAVDGEQLSGNMNEEDMYDGLEKAFNLWESVDTCDGSLTFINLGSENFDQADIKIGFYKHTHTTDGFHFYGSGQEKAHAFTPGNLSYSGEIHFNGHENWQYYRKGDSRDSSTTNFAWVAAHEIGHALGFGHSVDPNSIMRPWYPGEKIDAWLSRDDVEGLKDQLSALGRCCFGGVCYHVHIQDCCNTVGNVFMYLSPSTIKIKCDEYHKNHPSNCPLGYYSGGKGDICQDIDECDIAGGRLGYHLCGRWSCKNTQGSYSC